MSDRNWTFLNLSNGEKAKVSKRDFKKANELSWRIVQKPGSHRQTVVATISTNKGPRQITLGKFLLKPPKGKFVYPRRGGLDYRRENLIVCTMAERQQMLPKRRNQESTSKYKGVCWDSTRRRWRSEIYISGKVKYIGFFGNEETAARAYNAEARLEFGKMAYQNQIIEKKSRRAIDAKKTKKSRKQ